MHDIAKKGFLTGKLNIWMITLFNQNIALFHVMILLFII